MNSKRQQDKLPKHIGIVAVSAPGAALCYQTIIAEAEKILGARKHPEITLTHSTFDSIYQAQMKRDWTKVAGILVDSVKKVAAAGSEFAVIPANSVHFAITEIQRRSPIPVLNLLDLVAGECKKRSFNHPLILGVGITMGDHLYDETLRRKGVITVYPSNEEKIRINTIIYSELVKGICKKDSTNDILHLIEKSKSRHADSVILACTELPLVISEVNSPLPTIDTTRLLAQKAIEQSI